MFLPLFDIYGTFTNGFINLMKNAFPEFDFTNIKGLAIPTLPLNTSLIFVKLCTIFLIVFPLI